MKSKSSKQDVYSDIRRRIISLDLAPSADLDEAELVEYYGVSRTPIRETLIRLHGEGLVELRRNRGAYVAPLNLPTLQSYFEAADFLHRAMVRMACQRRTKDDLAQIEEARDAFEKAIKKGDADEMVVWNYRFHSRIGQAARNKYLFAGYSRILADHERIAGLIFNKELETDAEEDIQITIDQHNNLYKAICNRDIAAAELVSSDHLNLCRDGIADLMSGTSSVLEGLTVADISDLNAAE